ncbi:hypothetical protein IEQ34_017028 [Dendrobium chrysotoxum]|uniref:EF-hand domain-containing protein n=1 Tax=Dendrobium chrysotoxum TaxID=161865 RepID=A0AAV7GHJ5_DENCH|nr:hypothetical protein IEQ34_017028 [Dendrobium chrysotoxum]
MSFVGYIDVGNIMAFTSNHTIDANLPISGLDVPNYTPIIDLAISSMHDVACANLEHFADSIDHYDWKWCDGDLYQGCHKIPLEDFDFNVLKIDKSNFSKDDAVWRLLGCLCSSIFFMGCWLVVLSRLWFSLFFGSTVWWELMLDGVLLLMMEGLALVGKGFGYDFILVYEWGGFMSWIWLGFLVPVLTAWGFSLFFGSTVWWELMLDGVLLLMMEGLALEGKGSGYDFILVYEWGGFMSGNWLGFLVSVLTAWGFEDDGYLTAMLLVDKGCSIMLFYDKLFSNIWPCCSLSGHLYEWLYLRNYGGLRYYGCFQWCWSGILELFIYANDNTLWIFQCVAFIVSFQEDFNLNFISGHHSTTGNQIEARYPYRPRMSLRYYVLLSSRRTLGHKKNKLRTSIKVASEISFSNNGEEFSLLFSRIDVDGDDSDGDGFLDMEEFMAVAGIIDDACHEVETKKEEQYLKEAFSHYKMDDHQGFINAKSLKRMLSRLGASRPIEDYQSMICRFDLNRDGLLSFDELWS